MSRQDQIIALIRTGVPGLVGALLAFIIGRVPFVAVALHATDDLLARAGLAGVSTALILQAALVAVVIAAYYWLARRIGARWPAAEKWLLGHSATPLYTQPTVTPDGPMGPLTRAIIPGTTLSSRQSDPPKYGS